MASPASKVSLDAFARKIGSPLYAQVRQGLRELIQTQFKDGDRFFTERDLINRLSVSQSTLRRAVLDLVAEGLLERDVGRGTFVRKKARERSIGIFIPNVDSAVVMDTIRSIAAVCSEQDFGFHLYYLEQGGSPTEARRALRRSPKEERILFFGMSIEDSWALYQELESEGYRSVRLGGVIPGYPGSSVQEDVCGGVRIAVDHLASLGHRRIVFLVNEPIELPTVGMRVAEMERLVRTDLPESRVFHCGIRPWEDSFRAAYSAMKEVLALCPTPTAICPVSGAGSWGALRYLTEHRISVPGEVSLFSFDDLPGSTMVFPTITALAIQREQAQLAIDMLWDEDPRPRTVSVPLRLVARESTGPAPSAGQ